MKQGDRCFLPHWVISTRNNRTVQLCFSPVYWHCETGNQQFILFTATLPADKQHNVLFSARASTEWFITNEPKPWKRKHYLPEKSSNTSFQKMKCTRQTKFDILEKLHEHGWFLNKGFHGRTWWTREHFFRKHNTLHRSTLILELMNHFGFLGKHFLNSLVCGVSNTAGLN